MMGLEFGDLQLRSPSKSTITGYAVNLRLNDKFKKGAVLYKKKTASGFEHARRGSGIKANQSYWQ